VAGYPEQVTLKARIDTDLKAALRSGDEVRKTALRMLMAAVRNAEIAAQRELDDDGVIALVQREIKQRRDSIEQFEKGGRADLVAKEQAEITALEPYLPEQLSVDEIRAIAEDVIASTGASGPGDKGKVMGPLMGRVRGKADGKLVNQVVGELLGG